MEGWSKLSSSLNSINFGSGASKLAKGFSSGVQATKERLGQVDASEITELPQEYKDLESRVDKLRNAHLALYKIAKVYETETYDYPVQIQESIAELSTSISAGVTNFAAHNFKGTNLPTPAPVPTAESHHKTLPHALGRAGMMAAAELGPEDRLGKGLAEYAAGMDKIAVARVEQDERIKTGFLIPWHTTLSTSIQVAMKARQAVRVSRLELDAAKQTLKSASPARQEHARLEVENAEDDLVQKTEVAITLMKTVLENPEPLKNLNEFIKAQIAFYAAAGEALAGVQGEVEELGVAAEGDYRKSRDH